MNELHDLKKGPLAIGRFSLRGGLTEKRVRCEVYDEGVGALEEAGVKFCLAIPLMRGIFRVYL